LSATGCSRSAACCCSRNPCWSSSALPASHCCSTSHRCLCACLSWLHCWVAVERCSAAHLCNAARWLPLWSPQLPEHFHLETATMSVIIRSTLVTFKHALVQKMCRHKSRREDSEAATQGKHLSRQNRTCTMCPDKERHVDYDRLHSTLLKTYGNESWV